MMWWSHFNHSTKCSSRNLLMCLRSQWRTRRNLKPSLKDCKLFRASARKWKPLCFSLERALENLWMTQDSKNLCFWTQTITDLALKIEHQEPARYATKRVSFLRSFTQHSNVMWQAMAEFLSSTQLISMDLFHSGTKTLKLIIFSLSLKNAWDWDLARSSTTFSSMRKGITSLFSITFSSGETLESGLSQRSTMTKKRELGLKTRWQCSWLRLKLIIRKLMRMRSN